MIGIFCDFQKEGRKMYRNSLKEKLNQSENKKLSNIPNYLILIENNGKLSEIIPVYTFSKVVEIARNEKQNLIVFEKAGKASTCWRFYCTYEVM